MTTNKPEELAWTWMYRKIRRVTTDYSRALCLSEPPYSIKIEPLIRLSAYEALQAECEKLRKRARTTEREYSKALRTLKGLERVAKVVSDNSDAACGENNQLRVECEKLRKDAERWREIRKGGDSVRVVFTDWDAMKDYVLSNEEADSAIDAATQTDTPC